MHDYRQTLRQVADSTAAMPAEADDLESQWA